MILKKGKYPEGYYSFNVSNIAEIDITKLEKGDKILILDTSNYNKYLSKYPCEGVVKEITDYPCVWVEAEGKEWELYETQIGVYRL